MDNDTTAPGFRVSPESIADRLERCAGALAGAGLRVQRVAGVVAFADAGALETAGGELATTFIASRTAT